MPYSKSLLILISMICISPVSAFAQSAPATIGKASYYQTGKTTANGEHFNPNGMTAAHKTLPFGTRLLVTNVATGKSVVVRVNDRGPFIRGRVLDLARGAAAAIGMIPAGTASVRMALVN